MYRTYKCFHENISYSFYETRGQIIKCDYKPPDVPSIIGQSQWICVKLSHEDDISQFDRWKTCVQSDLQNLRLSTCGEKNHCCMLVAAVKDVLYDVGATWTLYPSYFDKVTYCIQLQQED